MTTPAFLTAKPQLEVPQFTEAVKTLVWMTDANGLLSYLSRNVSHLFDEGTVLSFSVYAKSIHVDDTQRVADVFHTAIKDLKEFQIDYRVIGRQGAIHWVMGSGAPRFSSNGDFCGYTGALIDVTDRYEAIERLAESEATHRLLTENSSDLISHHAADSGIYLYASPSFKRMLGFEPSELVGQKSPLDYIHPEDKHFVKREILRQLQTGADSEVIEFRIRDKDERYLWVATNIKVLSNPITKEKIGSIAITRDITAERKAREDLTEREERFRSLTNLSSDWYWETDAQGRFSFKSESQLTSLGLPTAQLIGKTRCELAVDLQDPGLQQYFSMVANRQPFRNIRYKTKGLLPETVRHACISGEPTYREGRFQGYRGIGRDVTEEVEISAQVAQLAEENRALVENSVDIIASLDPHGRFLRVNAAAFDICNYSAAVSVAMSSCKQDGFAASLRHATEATPS